MDSPTGRNLFQFGKKNKDQQSDDEYDDYKPKRAKRGGKKVGFARDDSELFKKNKSNHGLPKAKNRRRGQSVDSYARDAADKPSNSMMKKFGVIFKSASRSEDEQDRGRSMKRNASKDSDDYAYGEGLGTNNYANMQHAASFPAHHRGGFTLDGVGTNSARSAPQLPPEFPAVANLSTTPMMHAPGERARYSVYHGAGGFTGAAKPVKRKFRVRPYHCFDEPVNMTEEEIYKDSLKPSKSFEFLTTYIKPPTKVNRGLKVPQSTQKVWGTPEKDGRLGSFKVELLGCIGLARPKPDVCVYVVCADMAFCTDVVTSYRSPMWPCASRRGAVFPINHAYAQVSNSKSEGCQVDGEIAHPDVPTVLALPRSTLECSTARAAKTRRMTSFVAELLLTLLPCGPKPNMMSHFHCAIPHLYTIAAPEESFDFDLACIGLMREQQSYRTSKTQRVSSHRLHSSKASQPFLALIPRPSEMWPSLATALTCRGSTHVEPFALPCENLICTK